MHEHQVIVYINAAAKTFTVTARKPSARLEEVNDWAKRNGFSQVTISTNIDKISAEA